MVFIKGLKLTKEDGVDNRGSKLQRLIYDLSLEAYPNYQVEYEYVIPSLNQRIDIFIPTLGIALEIHGQQHYQYNSFFFKDELDWNKSVMLDKNKAKYLEESGIKLVEIPYNTKIKTAKELKDFIDSIEFPFEVYTPIEKISDLKKSKLEKQRDYRKKMYLKMKNNNDNG